MNRYLQKWNDIVESVIPKKTAKDLKKIKTLAVFDFDKTLFRSPDAPKGHKGNWHIKIDSLTSPIVSDVPKDNMWNMQIVNKSKELIDRPDVYCIMLTGRIDNIFEDRVNQLLLQKELVFDIVRLNEFGGDTVDFKVNTIKSLIDKMPNLDRLTMWDDDEEKIEKYKEIFSNKDYDFVIHTVDESQIRKIKITFKT
jgi:hypothetical protein